MCGWSIPITIPNQSQVAALVAKKKRALDINIYGPLGPTYFSQHMVFIYHCGCMDHQYLSPYQTRAKWLPWLLRKSRPFVFLYGPLGPLTFICGAKMVIHFHSCIMPHTCVKFGPWAYFSFWSTRGAKKFALGPLGPLTFVLGAKMAVSFHPCNMPHKCAKFGPWGYFTF